MIIKSKCNKFDILIDDEDYKKVIDFAVNGWEIKYTTGSNNPYVLTRKTITVIQDDKPKRVRKQYYLHRLIMDAIDMDINIHVDHININTLDNRKSNLRFVNRTQNMKNRTSKKTSYCKYLGVSYNKSKRGDKKYRVNIQDESIKKGNIHLGYYYDEDSAGYAYNIAAEIIHKEYANLNDVNMNNVDNPDIIKEYVYNRLDIYNVICN